MSTNYPSGFDLFPSRSHDSRVNDGVTHSQLHTNLGHAIEAIQSALGINPQAAATTVDTRIAETELDIQSLESNMIELLSDLGEIQSDLEQTQQDISEVQNGLIDVGYMQIGTYTPTLTGMVIGSGGSATNAADYVFIGGTETGNQGLMHVIGTVTFGSSGQTFPTAPTISIPSGFTNVSAASSSRPCGSWHAVDIGTGANNRIGPVFISIGGNLVRPLLGGDDTQVALISTTTPFTWASGDSIYWEVNLLVERL